MHRQLVVIVDDRVTNLKILEKLAASLGPGTRVETFTDPLAALAFAAAEGPDLVVTDLKMPRLDGIEFIRRLRREARASEAPIIVITAYEDRELRYRALNAGATDYLLSPVDHREFQARSRNLLLLRQRQLLVEVKARTLEEQIAEEERRHRDALEASHARLLRVIDAVPAMIWASDREGRLVFVNNEFAAVIGEPARGLIGRRADEIRDGPLWRCLGEQDEQLFDDTPVLSFEEEIVDAAGRRRLLLVTKSALTGTAGEAMTVTVAVDITARKAAELALVAAREQAELANRSKTEFLANMSHELRTPLNAIIGFSQIMAGEMLGPMATRKYVGYARDIAGSAEHLLGIINDILDVSKIEAGKLELVEGAIDLGKTIRDLVRIVEEKARENDIRITEHFAPDVPELLGDVRKVKQILLNLLSNAIKFSHRGGEVEITLATEAGRIAVAVADHGIGMDKEEREVAVARFGQVASAWSRKHTGTGLGLPLAIGLAELHGATISIEGEKGVGTTLTLTFPRERSLMPPPALAAGRRRASSGA
ncbi:MAG TPA: ATP-binding protein [Stellaceae bacterium]|nr:ATP-binding protein [Stellaceae bacterium]